MANKKKRGLNRGDIILIGVIAVTLSALVIGVIAYNTPSTNPKKLIGEWLYDTSDINLLQDNSLGNVYSTYWSFFEDGKLTILIQGGMLTEFTYTADDGRLVISSNDGDLEYTYSILKGTLKLGDPDNKSDYIELKKQ